MRHGSRIAAALACVALLVACLVAGAASDLRQAAIWFSTTGGAGDSIQDMAVARYEMGLCGLTNYTDAAVIKAAKPSFLWLIYNSISDNYIGSSTDNEEEILAANAAAHGWDPEEGYLHYYDDTQIYIQQETITIPGWGGGTATTKAESRVVVYYKNKTRRATNFCTPRALQLQLETILEMSVDSTFLTTNLHPDGITFDNCAPVLRATGTVVAGGHVLESPYHSVVGSEAFQDWYWNYNLGPFLTALTDTLATSELWTEDLQHKYLAINTANSWSDGYISRDVADYINVEFCYSPVRTTGLAEVGQVARRDALAGSGGMATWYMPLPQTTVPTAPGTPPLPGEVSYAEAIMGGLCWHLVTRSQNAPLYIQGCNGPSSIETAVDYDTTTWRGCIDVANDSLGLVDGDPYILASGTDPMGQAYAVWARHYDNGLVLVRNRHSSIARFDDSCDVVVALPDSFVDVSPEGVVGTDSLMSITIGNGTGRILLGAPGAEPARAPVTYFYADVEFGPAPLTVNFTDYSTGTPTGWAWIFGDGGTSPAQNPTYIYDDPGLYTVRLTATNAQGGVQLVRSALINVSPALVAPVADFVASATTGTMPLTVTFTDLSVNWPTSWVWTFGDGDSSTVRNPVHTYTEYGTYDVKLTATNSAGADDSTKVDYIDSPWVDSDWLYRMPVVVCADSIAGAATLLDYQLLVYLTGAAGDSVFAHATADGGDILITEEDGVTACGRELVSYDVATHDAEIWVNCDTLSAAENTFYIYYGRADYDVPYVAADVWNPDFLGVYHFEDTPADSELWDSGPGANHGVGKVDWTAEDVIDGAVGQAWLFDGYNWIDGDLLSSADSSYTFSSWAAVWYPDSANSDLVVDVAEGWWLLSYKRNPTNVVADYLGQNTGDRTREGNFTWYPILPDTLLHHYVFWMDGVGDTIRFFYDGTERAVRSRFVGELNTSGKVYQGNQISGEVGIASPKYGWQNDCVAGIVDEWWLYEGTQADAGTIDELVLTEYRNQKYPSTFVAFGDQEVIGEEPEPPPPLPDLPRKMFGTKAALLGGALKWR